MTSLGDLKPLSDGEPVWGILPVKMSNGEHLSDEELKALSDNEYVSPGVMVTWVLLGLLSWGLIGFVVWIYMAVTVLLPLPYPIYAEK